jgi:hypothetical protein
MPKSRRLVDVFLGGMMGYLSARLARSALAMAHCLVAEVWHQNVLRTMAGLCKSHRRPIEDRRIRRKHVMIDQQLPQRVGDVQ